MQIVVLGSINPEKPLLLPQHYYGETRQYSCQICYSLITAIKPLLCCFELESEAPHLA